MEGMGLGVCLELVAGDLSVGYSPASGDGPLCPGGHFPRERGQPVQCRVIDPPVTPLDSGFRRNDVVTLLRLFASPYVSRRGGFRVGVYEPPASRASLDASPFC